MLNKFYSKLESYINKTYQNPNASAFKYEELTIIAPEIAREIYFMYQQLLSIQQLLEKEMDYSRLLKKENDELREELFFYENEEEEYEDLDVSIPKEKEYVS